MKQKLVVFTGAGISAESGLSTFRAEDGLWEKYNIEDVATPEAWEKNRELVLNFYKMRYQDVLKAQPNTAHHALAKLEEKYDVQIITQNIDDLHERAGSTKVLHLHGIITQVRGEDYSDKTYEAPATYIKLGDTCPNGSQLRPHIVWFGEDVPEMDKAFEIAQRANIFVVIGTSLNVYPAAGIIHYTKKYIQKYLIDPNDIRVKDIKNLTTIKEKASIGVPLLALKYL